MRPCLKKPKKYVLSIYKALEETLLAFKWLWVSNLGLTELHSQSHVLPFFLNSPLKKSYLCHTVFQKALLCGAREMAQLVKCFLRRHEATSFISSTHMESWAWWCVSVITLLGRPTCLVTMPINSFCLLNLHSTSSKIIGQQDDSEMMVLATNPNDPSLMPRTDVMERINSYKFSSDFHMYWGMPMCTHIETHT